MELSRMHWSFPTFLSHAKLLHYFSEVACQNVPYVLNPTQMSLMLHCYNVSHSYLKLSWLLLDRTNLSKAFPTFLRPLSAWLWQRLISCEERSNLSKACLTQPLWQRLINFVVISNLPKAYQSCRWKPEPTREWRQALYQCGIKNDEKKHH